LREFEPFLERFESFFQFIFSVRHVNSIPSVVNPIKLLGIHREQRKIRMINGEVMIPTNVNIPMPALEAMCRKYHVRELLIFGSALQDDFRPESDVDLLVEFEPEARIGFIALAELQAELSQLLGKKVDLVPKGGLKPLIRDSILSSAKVLYHAA
jgi:predicted nucleotidyltransferase